MTRMPTIEEQGNSLGFCLRLDSTLPDPYSILTRFSIIPIIYVLFSEETNANNAPQKYAQRFSESH